MNAFAQFRVLFDSDYRGNLTAILVERGVPLLLGILIILIGVAFILAGTTAGKAATTVVETLATKGTNLVTS